MLKIKIISIGNKIEKNVDTLIDSYTKKCSHFFHLEWVQLKSEKRFDSVAKKKVLEAEKIIPQIGSSLLVALDEKGEMLTSKNFTLKISQWSQNFSCITFVIGGADGLDKSILKLANVTLSLSNMTLPHQLVKIFIAEQLYRASSILNNHPYHRE
ncbi:23S rRNA (pseudouridine(1915)-N(3))-methyltransferase RlmH [Methylophilaceae bacterium]|nr:23S rRNA (pseudouridine(1915)-N(3))-methyltransferase RlmH [Nitrosomonadales bacterium]MCH9841792.1 23S rRNA (pseudouridine(1915)-N(3))-methyltransferase RlmH [Betaproteobacteria bacterium]MDA7751609.1 23S rRNA (pseudouridine(1915)-N(3))-methyltransferase RlmH [Methylophilaceae bacterium]MDA9086091.1 23S rRNA (pseudouridine(1915)-N(3))-methyltransferase RlmH [Methylophilaceae bacterium]MDA9087901.1 23S rRNA (pseudouridine(1915)-N(3))-methyltransferase RlmH [Methylophilaceae bacterium]